MSNQMLQAIAGKSTKRTIWLGIANVIWLVSVWLVISYLDSVESLIKNAPVSEQERANAATELAEKNNRLKVLIKLEHAAAEALQTARSQRDALREVQRRPSTKARLREFLNTLKDKNADTDFVVLNVDSREQIVRGGTGATALNGEEAKSYSIRLSVEIPQHLVNEGEIYTLITRERELEGETRLQVAQEIKQLNFTIDNARSAIEGVSATSAMVPLAQPVATSPTPATPVVASPSQDELGEAVDSIKSGLSRLEERLSRRDKTSYFAPLRSKTKSFRFRMTPAIEFTDDVFSVQYAAAGFIDAAVEQLANDPTIFSGLLAKTLHQLNRELENLEAIKTELASRALLATEDVKTLENRLKSDSGLFIVASIRTSLITLLIITIGMVLIRSFAAELAQTRRVSDVEIAMAAVNGRKEAVNTMELAELVRAVSGQKLPGGNGGSEPSIGPLAEVATAAKQLAEASKAVSASVQNLKSPPKPAS